MALTLQDEEQLLLNYPNEHVDHEIQELQHELDAQSKQENLLQIYLISGDLVAIHYFLTNLYQV